MVMPLAPMNAANVKVSKSPLRKLNMQNRAPLSGLKNFQPVSALNNSQIKRQALQKKADFAGINNLHVNTPMVGSLQMKALSKRMSHHSALKATKSNFKSAPRKVAEFKDTYNATGIDLNYDENDKQVQTAVSWTMRPAEASYTDENKNEQIVTCFIDLVPEPEEFKEIEEYTEGIPYEYTIEGDSVFIMPQVIASSVYQETEESEPETDFYIFFNANSEDGSVRLAIEEDGALKSSRPLTLIIGCFTTSYLPAYEEFNDFYLGFYQYTGNVKYKYEGQADTDVPAGLAVVNQYTGKGVDYSTKEKLEWQAFMGTVETEANPKLPVFVDLLPSPSANLGNIYVKYTQEGNNITIPAQCVASGEDNNGTPFYLFLHSGSSDDGSISLTIDENGHLALANKRDALVYG
jgi:hypothetical protein